MKYENIVEGKFINRHNRFIAYVEVSRQDGNGTRKKYRAVSGAFAAGKYRWYSKVGQ